MSENEGQTPENTNPPEGNDGVSPSAQEALGEEQIGGDTPPQQESNSPSEQQERSRLGRRFTKFEQEMAEIKSQLANISSFTMQRAVPADDKPPVEYITTPEDIDKYTEWKNAKAARQRDAYASQYVQAVKSFNYMNTDLHAEIENELLTNVSDYPTYSRHQDPMGDARVNYMKAENKILKSRLTTAPKPNVRGGNNAPTGISGGDRIVNPSKPVAQLDEYASKFVKSLGEDANAEWVQKAVSRK